MRSGLSLTTTRACSEVAISNRLEVVRCEFEIQQEDMETGERVEPMSPMPSLSSPAGQSQITMAASFAATKRERRRKNHEARKKSAVWLQISAALHSAGIHAGHNR